MDKKQPILINLNTCSEKELIQSLKLSPRLAKRIIAMRPFSAINQLEQVWGLDEENRNRIKPRVTVGEISSITPLSDKEIPEKKKEKIVKEIIDNSKTIEDEKTELQQFEAVNFEDEIPPHLAEEEVLNGSITATKPKKSWKTNLILLLILLVAAYFRFNGINWDENHHMQPDARFITMVAEQIRGVDGIGAYFDTDNSTLNPLNHGSYTYGMFPLFITRAVAVVVGMANYDGLTLVGRAMSGLFDLAAIWMLFLVGQRLYNRRTGILAAALAAAAVLPIQLSHYFAVDSFSTVFVVASFYFALLAIPLDANDYRLTRQNLLNFVIFGFVVGLAGACKVNTIPVFGVIILAGLARLFLSWKKLVFRTNLIYILSGWGLALLFMALTFKIFQPYAFAGPGFFGLGLNERWLTVIKEVTGQVAGRSEWPPNHHWTNRPISYGWTNMVQWGLGIPLGLAGWLGLVWAGIRIWKGDWRQHLLPFTWVIAYFIWQNMQFWRYMRYFLPIYPFIILFAAWALLRLYDKTSESRKVLFSIKLNYKNYFTDFRQYLNGLLVLLLLIAVVGGTYGWAFAFSKIYDRPLTRIEASHWILENLPGPLNLIIDSAEGRISYPISIYNQQIVEPDSQPNISINVNQNGSSSQITTTDIRRLSVYVYFRLTSDEAGDQIITEGRLGLTDKDDLDQQIIQYGDIVLDSGDTYYFKYKIINNCLLTLKDVYLGNEINENPKIPIAINLEKQAPGIFENTIVIVPEESVRLNRLKIEQLSQEFIPSESVFQVSLMNPGDEMNPLAVSSVSLNFDEPGLKLQPVFNFEPVQISADKTYLVRYEIISGGPLQVNGESLALETSWDDALPLSVDGINALGGVYSPYNFELYEPDTPEKRERMIEILDATEYIVIPSNRAYDAMPRLPLRYPMTLKYYQALFGCDCSGDELEQRAYNLLEPFKSPLGFDLIKTFTSNPNLGPIVINDQNADESFTVYDHPKVFIFKKSKDFSIEKVKELLYSVDLEEVIFQTPMAYSKSPTAMKLSAEQIAIQTEGGTWSEMFNRESWLNSNQVLSVVVWYLLLLALGWLVFPIVYKVFSGLVDRGYALIRIMALLLVSWLAWMFGSLNLLAFTQLTIAFCVLIVSVTSISLIFKKRIEFLDFLKQNWKHLLGIEAIFLVLFLFSLMVRLGNPDLWNPWLGGEKPMEFAFFNAILKTVHFPPEHPWFSGHYINYYYYGYVIAAIPTKLLGILPSIAFNLILPSWFAMTGVGVFSAAFNLFTGLNSKKKQNQELFSTDEPDPQQTGSRVFKTGKGFAYLAGLLAMVFVLFMGNFYEVRLLWQYLPEASAEVWNGSSIFDRTKAFINGAKQVITTDQELPGNKGRWYFDASRPILHDGPDTPIAEFPYFTFLYGDLHPHLLAMPIFGLVFGWLISLMLKPLNKSKWKDRILILLASGLIFGSFRATHTWDFPTFIGLGLFVLVWTEWGSETGDLKSRIKLILGYAIAFIGLAIVFFLPFSHWFRTEYVSLEIWKGIRTPLFDYFGVFGLSLYVLISLMAIELYPDLKAGYRKWIDAHGWKIFIPVLLILVLISIPYILYSSDYKVLAFGFPIFCGIFYLIFIKRSLNIYQKIYWWLFAIGLSITFVVEVFVLKGDSGRSNMVFRMYNEAWFILGIGLSLALIDLIPKIIQKNYKIKISWFVIFVFLILSASSYPLIATSKKMTDRWPNIQNPPHNLDGDLFMLGEDAKSKFTNPAIYNDEGRQLDLSKDYAAIKFMQENVPGTPVIVEGQTSEYRWGARFSIHTGLPTVIGWSWHVRQHNSLLDGAIIEKRIQDVIDFYNTENISDAVEFLKKYKVQYIIVSDLERAYYSAAGISKFERMEEEDKIKREFGDGTANTATIYQVFVK